MTDPVKNMVWAMWPRGDVTQWFGENPELYQQYGSTKAHNGIDIVRPWGEHLFACEEGEVYDVKHDAGGYGKHVRILSKVKGENLYHDWAYGHLSHINVRKGERVKEGQYIGNMGNTGFVVSNATGNGFWDANPYAGTHLHLGVRDVRMVNKRREYLRYDNGYLGRYDPLPLFLPPEKKSTTVIRYGDKIGSKKIVQVGTIMRDVGL